MLTRGAAILLATACLSAVPVAADGHSAAMPRAQATTYAELPVGEPTTLPWWQRRRLHIGDTVIHTRRRNIASRHDTTIVAKVEGRPARWSLVQGDRLIELPMLTPTDKPLVSGNGRWLAWLEVRAPRTDAYRRVERYRVVVYDVAGQRIANSFRDRRLVEWEDGINAIWLRTLSNKGRLVLSQGHAGVKVLSPRGRPVRFGGPQVGNGAEPDGWPRGTTVFRSRTGASVYGSVGRDGSFERAGSFTVSFSGLWSAGGRRYAYADYDSGPQTSYWVRDLDGSVVRLDTPVDLPEPRIVGWESADALVLWSVNEWSSPPISLLLRCSPTTGACERVPGGPKAGVPATMASRY